MVDIFYIQVEDKQTGLQYPIPSERWDSSLFKRLDEPPVDPQTGAELPSKPKTTASREAAKKTTSKSKPQASTPAVKSAASPGAVVESTQTGQSVATQKES